MGPCVLGITRAQFITENCVQQVHLFPAAPSIPHTLFPPSLILAMAAKLLNLAAVASLALLACSFGPAPVNAVSLDMSPNHARSLGHHNLIAKKKRATTGRCKVRPTSSSVAVVSTSTTKPVSTTTKAAVTTSTKKTSTKASATPTAPAVAISGNNGNGKAGLAWINPSSVSLKPFVTEKTGRYVPSIYIFNFSDARSVSTPGVLGSLTPLPLPASVTCLFPCFGDLAKPPTSSALLLLDMLMPPWDPMSMSNMYCSNISPDTSSRPDLSGQANLSPSTVVSMWWQYMQPLVSKGYRLGTPAVTSGSSGKPWLQQFISSCSGCNVGLFSPCESEYCRSIK